MRPPRSGLRVGSVGLAVLAVAGTLGAGVPAGPDERPTPTENEAAASVRIFDIRGSVKVWDVAGSVSGLQTTTRTGGQTVLTLKSDILFDFSRAVLSPPAVARIGRLIADVPRGVRLAVRGYTDAIGSAAANRELSQRRADAVAAAVADRRADLVLDVVGRGEAEPVAPNTMAGKDNPEGRAKNRRVEIRYRSSGSAR